MIIDYFCSDFNNIVFVLKNLNLSEILSISGNIVSTKKADRILEIPGIGEFSKTTFKSSIASVMFDTLYIEIVLKSLCSSE